MDIVSDPKLLDQGFEPCRDEEGKFCPCGGPSKEEKSDERDNPESAFKPLESLGEAEFWASRNLQTTLHPLVNCELDHVNDILKVVKEAEDTIGGRVAEAIQFGGQNKSAYASHNMQTGVIHFSKKDTGIEERMQKDDAIWQKRYGPNVPFHAVPTKEGMVYHEIAHAVDRMNDYKLSGSISKMPTEDKRSLLKVSGYSGEDFFVSRTGGTCKEAFAESFSVIATNSPRAEYIPDSLAKEIRGVLNAN